MQMDRDSNQFNLLMDLIIAESSDAEYVDIIHTKGCTNIKDCMGILEPIGHVDFWPNGGKDQNGCSSSGNRRNMSLSATCTLCKHLYSPEHFQACSHRRAVQYFEESLRHRGSFKSCCYRSQQQQPPSNCQGGDFNNFMGQYASNSMGK